MSVRIPLGPLDAEGVRFDRPPSQVKWTELTNFVINEGRLESRPGFEVDNRGGAANVPSVQPSPILNFVEIWNPGSSATGRESYSPGKNNILPTSDADLVGTGWTGTYADIDDGTPTSGVMACGVVGDSTVIGFGNPGTTFAFIYGVVFHVRARMNVNGGWSKVNFYQRVGTTNYLIHSRVVTVREELESTDWEDFYFTLSRDLSISQPLTQADVNALQVVMEIDSAESGTGEMMLASASGTHSEWLDAQDGGTAVFGDCRGKDFIFTFTTSNLPTNRHIKSNGAGTRQSFVFGTVTNTYATITRLSVGGYARKPGGAALESVVQITYWNAAGTEFSLGTSTIYAGNPGRRFIAEPALNPDTGLAWTTADITGGEFGIKLVSGAQLSIGLFSVGILGTVTGGATVQIDVLNGQVVGVASSNPGFGLTDKTRLFSSSEWHNRYDSDYASPTITDVTNSVPLNSSGPGWPVNSTVLYGQAFLVNGVDPTVVYPSSGANLFGEIATNNSDGSTALTGRTVAAFGNRLFYGWVKDNATVTPERISYSKWNDGSTHNHRSAGDFDLLDTPGGVVAMVPLDEQLMGVLKEVGAYVIRRTGNDIFPFIRDVMHFDVGVIGPKTAQPVAYQDKNAIMFLGRTSANGISVYMFNGQSVSEVGGAISRDLIENMNHGTALLTAHAIVDPRTNSYWLFIPEGVNSFPKQAWIMSLTTGQWTRAEFPWEVYSSGVWHFPDRDFLNQASSEVIGGQPRVVIGAGGGYLPLASHDIGYDEMSHPSADVSRTSENLFDPYDQGQRYTAFTAKMTTGDLIKPGDMEAVSYKVGVIFKAIDPINRVLIDVSEDGGKNYKTSQEEWFGPLDNDNTDVRAPVGGIYFVEWDLVPSHAPQVRYRFRFAPEEITYDGTNAITLGAPQSPQRVEIHDMWLTIESGADSE